MGSILMYIGGTGILIKEVPLFLGVFFKAVPL